MSLSYLLVFCFLCVIPNVAVNSNETQQCGSNELLCNVTITQPCNQGDGASRTCLLFNNNTASWDCCLCDTNQTNCCGTCNVTPTVMPSSPPNIITTPANNLSTPSIEYVRILIIFFVRCSEYVKKEAEFIESFRSSVANLTNTDRNRLNVNGINCSTGAKPYCGIDVDNIHKHHRARRRAIGGGRGRSGGSDKKKESGINSNFFNDYYNVQEPDCNGLVVNARLKPSSLNKTLELMISHLYNRTFDITISDGSVLTAELILTAEKGERFSLYKAPPLPYFYPPLPPRIVPPLKTDLRPLIFTAGSVMALVVLYVVIRLIKHSIFLRMKKFTKINSNKICKRVVNADKEEKKAKASSTFNNPYDMTHNKLATSTYDWGAPAHLPNMLSPGYKPTDQTGQQSPPRLTIDESDGRLNSPVVGDDKVFDDILLSDNEDSKKQKREGTTSRFLASGKSSGSGKSSKSDDSPQSSTCYIKTRNKVSPDETRPQSAPRKSSMHDCSV